MTKKIHMAIDKIGTDIIVNGIKGRGIMYPTRFSQRTNGGVTSTSYGRADPHRYFLYCKADLMKNVHYGNIVSDGENEYYILWTDEVKSKFGDYTKACVRKADRGEADI